MKLLSFAKDGGKDSHVTGLFVVEIKFLFSIVLLHFRNGTREAYHSHAFNAVTWFVRGRMEEHRIDPDNPGVEVITEYAASFKPKYTPRENWHKVVSFGNTWALSFRGPWAKTWREYNPETKRFTTLTHGRKLVLPESRREATLGAVAAELIRATALFPPPGSPHEALGIITEEFEEFKDEVKRFNIAKGKDTRPAMKEELIQLAAMCVRAVENL